ncbi:DUF1428 domain-containing protein (plasmid) [Sphingomonas paeninsulae]|uniref:DUF1428 domain-containing protein n=1 Tax=Sphingomonas paeninsulae TaxID=2319844 RepID=A0A494T6P7_SPHPE|nr:DUF1428 domain-containing protein [Sphingomonas paeninsulae]AYJ85059.1 DUF1428 domain-containing protein [Sphingomonas paeninsulae]
MTYVQGLPDSVARQSGLYSDGGDGWGIDVPQGKVTDFRRAVDLTDDETVVFGWIEWPDKATRDDAWNALMSDPRMAGNKPAWNGPTAIFGGFAPVFDTAHA